MADAKITELTELTDPINTDIIPIVDDPGGTPITKKVTLNNLLRGLFTKVATLASDATTGANTTPIDVTGLSWSFEANAVYQFFWTGSISAAANTTGAGFQLNVDQAITEIAMSFTHQLANTGTLSGGSSTADDASLGVSSGIPTNSTNVPIMGQGILRTSSNAGTAQLRLRSETTAAISAKAGMTLVVMRVA